MIFLTIFGFTEILWSFRFVLEGKTSKEIPKSSRLAFLEKFLQTILLYHMQKTTPSVCWIEWRVPRAIFLESNGLFCFITICKFDSFKNTFATITSLSELYFRFRRLILLVQTKEVISMKYSSSTSSCKPWRCVRLDLILTMRAIHQFQPDPTHKIH